MRVSNNNNSSKGVQQGINAKLEQEIKNVEIKKEMRSEKVEDKVDLQIKLPDEQRAKLEAAKGANVEAIRDVDMAKEMVELKINTTISQAEAAIINQTTQNNTGLKLDISDSAIRGDDMAKEMVEYSKNNILTQAGQSMLTQANQTSQENIAKIADDKIRDVDMAKEIAQYSKNNILNQTNQAIAAQANQTSQEKAVNTFVNTNSAEANNKIIQFQKISSNYKIKQSNKNVAFSNRNENTTNFFSSVGKSLKEILSGLVDTFQTLLRNAQTLVNKIVSEAASTPESKIRDVDMAKEMVQYSKNNILNQTNQAIATQANQTSQENIAKIADDKIRDVDMAKEMVQYKKNNVLTQAGQSMLAQADQKNVLDLLE